MMERASFLPVLAGSKVVFASTATRSRSSTGSAPATSPWIRCASTTPITESSTVVFAVLFEAGG